MFNIVKQEVIVMEKMIKLRKVLECMVLLLILGFTALVINHTSSMFGLLALISLGFPMGLLLLTSMVQSVRHGLHEEEAKLVINMFDEMLFFGVKVGILGFSYWLIHAQNQFGWGLASLVLMFIPYIFPFNVAFDAMYAGDRRRVRPSFDTSNEPPP